MKVKSESQVAQSYPTLSDPMDCSLPGFSIHGIFQARVLERGAIELFSKLSNLQKAVVGTPYLQPVREKYGGPGDPVLVTGVCSGGSIWD